MLSCQKTLPKKDGLKQPFSLFQPSERSVGQVGGYSPPAVPNLKGLDKFHEQKHGVDGKILKIPPNYYINVHGRYSPLG